MLDAWKRDPWPRSHYDLIEHYHANYDKQVASGEIRPFLYPWGTFGAAIVIAYLLIPHQNRPWLKRCRYIAFAWITGFATYTILYARAKGMASSFGIGIVSSWSVAWVSAILICNDAQTDFQRIERLEGAFKGSKTSASQEDGNKIMEKKADQMSNGHLGPTHRHGSFAWQTYPLTPFIERLDWVLDIFCNFRGAGWNWRTSALPPPPKAIQEQLHRNSSDTAPPKTSNRIHPGQVRMYSTRAELLRANLQTFVKGYLMLDFLKTFMMHDPYFWGLVDRPAPDYPPYSFFASSPALIHITRLALSMLGVKTALQTIFALGPLFFSSLLGPALLGARAEVWMYPETWAPYSIVLDKGLAGWWGSWWHQTFRFAFQEPSRKAIEVLGMDRKSTLAKAGQLLTAFAMSGLVHASGSYTSPGETYPWANPFLFFMLQAVGIFVEASASQAFRRFGRNIPQSVMRIWTFGYVHVWFYFTAHLLCDDFARGGVWLFEPVPVSVLRGLGFGADKRDGWWCWNGVFNIVRWHRGESWWTTGIAF
ncbi:hypothetical protein HBI62_198500 [Parastagonospora nodorum]|nr:hypothetical protein HBI62_198500 [Parastagonospora nodorum]KAH6142646.1 hypothetical protein HBI63_188530 [Parastagonospora nodorum]KAH6170559.1 hypothetical protein HBI61_188840 [Parastagonospora nodorum]